jgi:hypothetical protein
VKRRLSVWRAVYARVIAGIMIALAALPVAAAEPSQAATLSVDLRAAVQKIAATERLAPTSASRAHEAAQPISATGPQSPSFFKTPLGAACIAIVSAGTVYALYSAQHDRIHSSAR